MRLNGTKNSKLNIYIFNAPMTTQSMKSFRLITGHRLAFDDDVLVLQLGV